MSQTRQNKIVTITNDETYDLATHMARMADSTNVVIPVYSTQERDALTKYVGLTVHRLDTAEGYREFWDGGAWKMLPQTVAADLVQFADPGWVITGFVSKTLIGTRAQVTMTGRATRATAVDASSINKILPGVVPVGYRPSITIDWLNNKMTSAAAIALHTNGFVAPNGDVTIKHDSASYQMFPGDYYTLQATWAL